MTNQLNLTQAEIELISMKREQEALKAETARLEKESKLKSDIDSAMRHIEKVQKEDAAQLAAAKKFLTSFGPGWSLVINEKTATEVIRDLAPSKPIVLWSKDYTRSNAFIVNGDYKVQISQHIVYTRWSSSNKGYKMQLSGPEVDYKYENKFLTKASTIEAKVKECIETVQHRNNYQNNLKNSITAAKNKLQSKYSECVITQDVHYSVDSRGRCKYTFPKLDIKFPNGSVVGVRVHENGEMSTLYVRMDALKTNNILDSLYSLK